SVIFLFLSKEEALIGWDFLVKANAFVDCRAPALYLRRERPQGMEGSFQASGFTSVPLLDLPNGMVVVKGAINSHDGWFMLDTGSPVTMIDRAQIKRYGLRARADLAQTI